MERDHGVGLHHPIDEEQASTKLRLRDLLHTVVPVVKLEHIFEAEDFGHLRVLLLIAEDVVRIGATAGVLIVGGADDVARVAFRNQLGTQAAGEIRQIIQMCVDGYEDFALMRLAPGGLFNDGLTQSGLLLSWKLSSLHRRIYSGVECSLMYFVMLSR